MNNTTRRHPRTLQEAFGPYCDARIADAHHIERRWNRVMYVLAIAFGGLWLAGCLVGA